MKSTPQDTISFKALGRAIRELRDARELTQSELARRTGLHPTYISRLEAGMHNPTYLVILQIAKGLEIRAAAIAKRSEEIEHRSD